MANPVDSTKPTRFKELHVTARGAGGKGHESALGAGTYVPLVVVVPAGQTVNAVEVRDTAGAVLWAVGPGGGLASAHFKYDFAKDGGASCTPAINSVIPATAIIVGAAINSTTAVTAAGSATVGIGTTAGSTTTSILAATAKASLSANAVLAGVPTFAVPVKMTAAGSVSILVATGPLTAGVIEGYVFYVPMAA